ncbi:MAG: ABC transporter ATP-binding protein [Bacteroidota bacterium]
MEDLLLSIKSLTVEFKSEGILNKAVDNISFDLEKGKTLGIVGESGSGKSVTSLAIMQLLSCPPALISSGEIVFKRKDGSDQDLLLLNDKAMRSYRGNEIAMIFQEPMTSLNPVYKCGKQVMEIILIHQKINKKEAKQKTIDLFNEVLLPDPEAVFNKYPHELSGGQKQRVMIAMAISCNPSLLIADEPTTALDVTVQKTILELLKKLQQKHGMSIMFITHDLGVVAGIADEVAVMYKGKIVEQNTVENIFKQPQHPYTKGLLACRPKLEYRVEVLPTVSDFVNVNEEDTIFKERRVNDSERIKQHQILYQQTPILTVNNINVDFTTKKNFFGKITKTYKAVNNVSFNVFEGETLGLVGESGCGKTTLGRTILQLIKASHGSVIYKGIPLSEIDANQLRHLRQKIQIIFQDPYSSLNPRLTIGSAIIEPMKVHNILANDKERKNKVIELLERVNMNESQYNRYPHEFSGGQRQRICIARALALNPELIICDESVSALDVSVQAQVLNLLNELKKEFKFTYIFISHDLSVVKFMSDRIIVMQKGEIVEAGDADSIYANPQSDYTRKLIASIPQPTF